MNSGYSETEQRAKGYRGVAVFGLLFGLQFAIRTEYAPELTGVFKANGYFPEETKSWDFGDYVRIFPTGIREFTPDEINDLAALAESYDVPFLLYHDGSLEKKIIESRDPEMYGLAKQLITQ